MSQVSLALPGVLDVDRSGRDPQDRYYTPQSTCAWLLWTPGQPRRFATVRVLP